MLLTFLILVQLSKVVCLDLLVMYNWRYMILVTSAEQLCAWIPWTACNICGMKRC